jgi:uncharacterized protein YicC (UPF0701 family)
MPKSMTGFGRGEAQDKNKKFLIEIKTVNNRFLDISITLSRTFTSLENKIQKVIGSKI